MQLIEGSTINVSCAVCGKETFVVTVMEGAQEVRCTNDTYWATKVRFQRAPDGHFSLRTYRV